MLADWSRASTAGQQKLTSKNTTRVFFEFSGSPVIKYPAIPIAPVAISPRKHPSSSAAGKGALRRGRAHRAQSAKPENRGRRLALRCGNHRTQPLFVHQYANK